MESLPDEERSLLNYRIDVLTRRIETLEHVVRRMLYKEIITREDYDHFAANMGGTDGSVDK